ncbi:MAG: GAF domain-containing protein, partial [Chloroflexi bacterium]|nr:GAF domain-containing protein [Chloroflexota bacterium]
MVREVLKDKTRAAGGAQAKAHRRREAAFGAAGRVKGARAGRHRALAKAALTLSGELSLESLLHKIVDLSRSLLKAEYGALSVLQEDGSLARFLTSGVSEEERKHIGEPPQGRGLLGVILRQGQVLRLADISKDPRSVGFPPRHPHVTSLLGVPIVSRGRILGNLYVANSAERTFSLKDQQLLEMFAAHAATAMENARLYAQAQEDRRSLAAIIESMQEGVYTVDQNGTVGLANKMAANLRGFQPKEVVGRYCGQVFNYHDDVGRSICDARCPAAECFRAGRGVLPREVYITSVSGEEVPVSLAAYPIVSADGQVNQVVEVFQDIRYRKEVDDLKSNIISHVSHELRTPLAHIKGFSSSLLQDDVQWDAATQRDFLETIDREADRLSRLVGDLLAMSRIESGATARAERVPLDPAAVAQVGIDSVSSFTQHHKVRLEVDKALPTILGDSTQLEHVIA